MELTFSFNSTGPTSARWIEAHTKGTPDSEVLRPFTTLQPQLMSTVRTASLSNISYEGGAGKPFPLTICFDHVLTDFYVYPTGAGELCLRGGL